MKLFHIEADAVLEAESIDDAFASLGRYYTALAEGREQESLYCAGSVRVGPCAEIPEKLGSSLLKV